MGDKIGVPLKVLVKRANNKLITLTVVPEEANPDRWCLFSFSFLFFPFFGLNYRWWLWSLEVMNLSWFWLLQYMSFNVLKTHSCRIDHRSYFHFEYLYQHLPTIAKRNQICSSSVALCLFVLTKWESSLLLKFSIV